MKPENLLLRCPNSNFDLKIADFGLATFVDEEDLKTTGFIGSDYYVSPDVILNQKSRGTRRYGCIADMWSIGVIAYVLLSGVPPFYGTNLKERIVKGEVF